jgi:hypothetical protein
VFTFVAKRQIVIGDWCFSKRAYLCSLHTVHTVYDDILWNTILSATSNADQFSTFDTAKFISKRRAEMRAKHNMECELVCTIILTCWWTSLNYPRLHIPGPCRSRQSTKKKIFWLSFVLYL